MASPPAAGRGPSAKRKRVVLTLREKMDVCARLERGESRRALMQEYNVGLSTLYDIRAHKARLLRFCAGPEGGSALGQRRTLHAPKLGRLDRALYQWFLAQRAAGVPVSGPMLVARAKGLYAQMRLTEPCVFSGGWLWRFKARHGIRRLDAAGARPGAERQAAERFCGFFRGLAAEQGLGPEQLYNAAETGLFWRCPPGPGPGPGPEGGAAPGQGQGLDRLTVLLCANATGSHRIRPLVVGKGGGPRALRGPQHLPAACRAQGSAWLDEALFSDWFHRVFVPAVRERFRARGLPEDSRALLLLDGAHARPREAELAAGGIVAVFLPPGTAALLQPMDLGVRRAFMRHLASAPAALPGLRPRGSFGDTVLGVACAWEAVAGRVFSRAWRKLWPAATPAEASSSEEEAERGPTKTPGRAPALDSELAEGAPARPPQAAAGPSAEGELGGPAAPAPGTVAPGGGPGGADVAAWAEVAGSFDAVVRFAERQPCFSEQELGQLRALHDAFSRRRPRAWVKLEVPRERAPPPCPSSGH